MTHVSASEGKLAHYPLLITIGRDRMSRVCFDADPWRKLFAARGKMIDMNRRMAMIGLLLIPLAGCVSHAERYRAESTARAQSHEAQAGIRAFQKFLDASDVIVSHDPGIRDRVVRVFVRLVETAKRSQFGDLAQSLPWEHVVIKNDQKVTGLAFPGGKIVLYTGLIAAAETDDQLAAAMGHLVAKILTRHQAEEISRNFMKEAGGAGPDLRFGKPPKSEDLAKAWRKAQREEADSIGMLLSAEAGYDPRGAIALYKRLEGQGSSRANHLEERLPEAMARFKAYQPASSGTMSAP
ncbi:MAG: M48 family metalloprotease [Nitrospira sp.]